MTWGLQSSTSVQSLTRLNSIEKRYQIGWICICHLKQQLFWRFFFYAGTWPWKDRQGNCEKIILITGAHHGLDSKPGFHGCKPSASPTELSHMTNNYTGSITNTFLWRKMFCHQGRRGGFNMAKLMHYHSMKLVHRDFTQDFRWRFFCVSSPFSEWSFIVCKTGRVRMSNQ